MPTAPFRPALRLILAGLAIVFLDLTANFGSTFHFDFLPDPIGWLLVARGLFAIQRAHPSFAKAERLAEILVVISLCTVVAGGDDPVPPREFSVLFTAIFLTMTHEIMTLGSLLSGLAALAKEAGGAVLARTVRRALALYIITAVAVLGTMLGAEKGFQDLARILYFLSGLYAGSLIWRSAKFFEDPRPERDLPRLSVLEGRRANQDFGAAFLVGILATALLWSDWLPYHQFTSGALFVGMLISRRPVAAGIIFTVPYLLLVIYSSIQSAGALVNWSDFVEAAIYALVGREVRLTVEGLFGHAGPDGMAAARSKKRKDIGLALTAIVLVSVGITTIEFLDERFFRRELHFERRTENWNEPPHDASDIRIAVRYDGLDDTLDDELDRMLGDLSDRWNDGGRSGGGSGGRGYGYRESEFTPKPDAMIGEIEEVVGDAVDAFRREKAPSTRIEIAVLYGDRIRESSNPPPVETGTAEIVHSVPPGFSIVDAGGVKGDSGFEGPRRIRHDRTGYELVLVPSGGFMMGLEDDGGNSTPNSRSAQPAHRVYLDAYWIGVTEVTNGQVRVFNRNHNSRGYAGESLDGKSQPAARISSEMAEIWCVWTQMRLPTEAEWEKAARGNDRRAYPWGNFFDPHHANYADSRANSEWRDPAHDDSHAVTALVGSFPKGASPYGCLDMAGNVWEWTADWYEPDHYANSLSDVVTASGAERENPRGPSTGRTKVLRGGSFLDPPGNLIAALRNGDNAPDADAVNHGFRASVSPVNGRSS